MKYYRVLIWGTGNWCERLLCELPHNCIIEAFVETNPVKEKFKEKKIISINEFKTYYEKTDFTIVAVAESDEIRETIKSAINKGQNVFFCKQYKGKLYCSSIYSYELFDIKKLFSENFVNTRLASRTMRYTTCECQDVTFLVNSGFKLMINALLSGLCFQQNDMEIFFDLSEQYYGQKIFGGGYFFDIGGNIGTTSVWVKKKLNPELKIIAFEPVKENCKQFQCNCILNDIAEEDYILVNAALSNVSDTADCMLSENNMGDCRIISGGNEDETLPTEKIKTLKLDDWIKDNEIDESQIKYIWMDVEAHEGFVIEGAEQTLMANNIPLFMEFWPQGLKENQSLKLLVEKLKKCYRKFICIEWYKKGNKSEYDLDELFDIADKYCDGHVFNIFLIK